MKMEKRKKKLNKKRIKDLSRQQKRIEIETTKVHESLKFK